MPTFSYKALREDKTSYTGTMEAKDRFAVYAQIRKEGGEVVRVTQTKSHSLSFQGDILAPFRRVKEIEVALLTRNLSTMLRAGLPLSRALSVLERQSKNPKTKDTLKSIAHELEQGGSLSSGMKRHPRAFSPLVCAMVEAGEESGTLSETLATISTQLTANYELKKRVRGAMLYPSIILTVLIAVGILMMVLVVPALSVAFRDLGADLPFTTKLVLSLSDALRSHGFLVALLALMMGSGLVGVSRTKTGRSALETTLLHVPTIGTIIREVNCARTARTLSSLLSAGVNMLTAITTTENVVQNTHFKKVLAQAEKTVQKGEPLGEVFSKAEDLYPPLMGELIAVGEETGSLPAMLLQSAEYYENEVAQKTKNISTIIEPLLMVFVGIAVGFFALAMIAPIYSMSDAIK